MAAADISALQRQLAEAARDLEVLRTEKAGLVLQPATSTRLALEGIRQELGLSDRTPPTGPFFRVGHLLTQSYQASQLDSARAELSSVEASLRQVKSKKRALKLQLEAHRRAAPSPKLTASI